MRIIAIDPGNVKSAWVLYDTLLHRPITSGHEDNTAIVDSDLLSTWPSSPVDLVVCEMLQNYGMSAGRSMFETALWVGEFRAKARANGLTFKMYGRPTIKGHLGAKNDAEIRASLRGRLCSCGSGGACKKGCVMHGMNNDVRAALALAVALDERPTLKEW